MPIERSIRPTEPEAVKPKRYSIVVENHATGVIRRFTIRPRPWLACLALIFLAPLLFPGRGLRERMTPPPPPGPATTADALTMTVTMPIWGSLSDRFGRLRLNVENNSLTNTRLFQSALTDSSGEQDLLIADPEHAGQSTLGRFSNEVVRAVRQEKVLVQRLDDLVSQESLGRLHLLKLDVEGAEVRVLQGAGNVLREMRPLILFEVLDEALVHQGSSTSELLELLHDAQYSVWRFDPATGVPPPGGCSRRKPRSSFPTSSRTGRPAPRRSAWRTPFRPRTGARSRPARARTCGTTGASDIRSVLLSASGWGTFPDLPCGTCRA